MTTGMTGRVGRPASAATNHAAPGAADGRHPDHQRVGPAGSRLGPAGSRLGPAGSRLADIIDLILAHHRRIRRLADVLETVARRGGDDSTARVAGLVWGRLAELLDVCAQAEREICFLPLFGPGPGCDSGGQWLEAIADLEDIRAAVQEAALQPAGSPAWWRAVSAASRFTRSHLDTVEQRVLTAFALGATPEFRRVLGEQWVRFTAALLQDRSEDFLEAPVAGARLPHDAPGSD